MVRFSAFDILATPVRFLASDFNSRTSFAVHARLTTLLDIAELLRRAVLEVLAEAAVVGVVLRPVIARIVRVVALPRDPDFGRFSLCRVERQNKKYDKNTHLQARYQDHRVNCTSGRSGQPSC